MSEDDSEGIGESVAAFISDHELPLVEAALDPALVDEVAHQRSRHRSGEVIASFGPIEIDPQHRRRLVFT